MNTERFEGSYPCKEGNRTWSIDASRRENEAVLTLHIVTAHPTTTRQEVATAQIAPAAAQRLAFAVAPELRDVVTALRAARETLNDLNSAYGSGEIQRKADACTAALAKIVVA